MLLNRLVLLTFFIAFLGLQACAQTDTARDAASITSYPRYGNMAVSNGESAEKQKLVQELIDKEDFLGLFKNAEKIGYEKMGHNNFHIEGPVMQYFNAHAGDRESIIELLKGNGFSVYTGDTYENKMDGVGSYDEEIYGERTGARIYIFPIHNTYKIFVYMKNGRADRIIAHAFVDGL